MPRIELPIKHNYVPKWGLFQGVRELLQNAKDEEEQNGNKMSVSYSARGRKLTVFNLGADIDRSALLLGHTTKDRDRSLRGIHGEGLDLSMLALARDGYEMVVTTQTERWRPTILASKEYSGERVLCVDFRQKRKKGIGVEVVVTGIDKGDWDQIKKEFLFLMSLSEVGEFIETSRGRVLLSSDLADKVYVKGIFVQVLKNGPGFGFDLISDVELTRDREVVDPWSLEWNMSHMLGAAMVESPGVISGKVYTMLKSGDSNLASRMASSVSYMDQDKAVVDEILTSFYEEHGAGAVPARDLDECKKLEHHNHRGVVVSPPLFTLLSRQVKTMEVILKELREEEVASYSWDDLLPFEQFHLSKACDLIKKVDESFSGLKLITPVDFHEESNLMGLRVGVSIKISRDCLESLGTTLEVIIHEWSHMKVGVGESHSRCVELLWKGVFEEVFQG